VPRAYEEKGAYEGKKRQKKGYLRIAQRKTRIIYFEM
jgi:hypothetical protein